MTATIHQAYFIPWLGYFSKLAFSDVFVILDDVKFRKRHYFDRTRIIDMHGKVKWISLPSGQNHRLPCRLVHLSAPDATYIDHLLQTVESSYARARCFDSEWRALKQAIAGPLRGSTSLVEINVEIITNVMNLVGLEMPDLRYSSSYDIPDENPTVRVGALCKEVGIGSIILGGGSSAKVHDWSVIAREGVKVYMQDYLTFHPCYEQSRRRRAGFQPGLSIVDAILNVGRKRVREFLVSNDCVPVAQNDKTCAEKP